MSTVTAATRESHDDRRRREIVDAARACFLQFGYAKTSLEDIAKRAQISRPLIYRTFANKEEILAAVFDSMIAPRFPRAEAAARGPGGKAERLFGVYEVLLLEPWDEFAGSPMAGELYEACSRLHPDLEAKRARVRSKLTQAILGSRELAELFILAVDGLSADLPTTAALRRRLRLLVDRFVA